MTLHITVTAEDIALGGSNAGDCPVALAIKRAATEAGYAEARAAVNSSYFWLTYTAEAVTGVHVDISKTTASAWVRAYDDGMPVKPFEFDVEVPS